MPAMTTTTTQSIWFLDALARIHVDSRETDGRFGLVEMRLPCGHQPPPHIHDDEDECFYVLEGEITIHTPNQQIDLGPGQAYNAPRGVPHTFCVTSPEARLLTIGAPAGFEAFVRAFGTPAEREELPVLDGPPDVEALVRVAADHGIRLVGPPGALPADVA
jgi:mannose-6-phosphate isomerase-like protein (cupin superfamily)